MGNRTTITIHQRERSVLRPVYGSAIAHCQQCDEDVLMLSPSCAAGILHVNAGVVHELARRGLLHGWETSSGATLICCNSLSMVSTDCQIEIEGTEI